MVEIIEAQGQFKKRQNEMGSDDSNLPPAEPTAPASISTPSTPPVDNRGFFAKLLGIKQTPQSVPEKQISQVAINMNGDPVEPIPHPDAILNTRLSAGEPAKVEPENNITPINENVVVPPQNNDSRS